MWFDSHCHLDFAAFAADRQEVIHRAKRVGVERIFVPGVRVSQWAGLSALQEGELEIGIGVGLHPYFLHEVSARERGDGIAQLREHAVRLGAWAIGECGVDNRLPRRGGLGLDEQLEVVAAHLDCATELNLPLVLHVVGGHGRLLSMLTARGYGGGGVLHSYSGSVELVARYAEMGFYFGFGASVTRPSANKVLGALRAVPQDRLVLETDAPDQVPTGFEPPVPSRNEPAALPYVARRVAELRGVSVPELGAITTDNARRLYGSR